MIFLNVITYGLFCILVILACLFILIQIISDLTVTEVSDLGCKSYEIVTHLSGESQAKRLPYPLLDNHVPDTCKPSEGVIMWLKVI